MKTDLRYKRFAEKLLSRLYDFQTTSLLYCILRGSTTKTTLPSLRFSINVTFMLYFTWFNYKNNAPVYTLFQNRSSRLDGFHKTLILYCDLQGLQNSSTVFYRSKGLFFSRRLNETYEIPRNPPPPPPPRPHPHPLPQTPSLTPQ